MKGFYGITGGYIWYDEGCEEICPGFGNILEETVSDIEDFNKFKKEKMDKKEDVNG